MSSCFIERDVDNVYSGEFSRSLRKKNEGVGMSGRGVYDIGRPYPLVFWDNGSVNRWILTKYGEFGSMVGFRSKNGNNQNLNLEKNSGFDYLTKSRLFGKEIDLKLGAVVYCYDKETDSLELATSQFVYDQLHRELGGIAYSNLSRMGVVLYTENGAVPDNYFNYIKSQPNTFDITSIASRRNGRPQAISDIVIVARNEAEEKKCVECLLGHQKHIALRMDPDFTRPFIATEFDSVELGSLVLTLLVSNIDNPSLEQYRPFSFKSVDELYKLCGLGYSRDRYQRDLVDLMSLESQSATKKNLPLVDMDIYNQNLLRTVLEYLVEKTESERRFIDPVSLWQKDRLPSIQMIPGIMALMVSYLSMVKSMNIRELLILPFNRMVGQIDIFIKNVVEYNRAKLGNEVEREYAKLVPMIKKLKNTLNIVARSN